MGKRALLVASWRGSQCWHPVVWVVRYWLVFALSLATPAPAQVLDFAVPSSRCGAVAVDHAGNTYVASGLGVGEGCGSGLAKYDLLGNVLWTVSGFDCRSIALDDSGNSYVTGELWGTRDFDPGPGVFELTSAFRGDAFVAKYDTAGTFVWAFSVGGDSWVSGYGIAVDSSGNSYVTGEFRGPADFDPGPGVVELNFTGERENWGDLFVAKYDTAGNLVWAFPVGSRFQLSGYAIVVDGAGNCYITGDLGWCFSDSCPADFDPGPGVFELGGGRSNVSAGSSVFVAKYDSSGNLLWAFTIPNLRSNPISSTGRAIALDYMDNSYVAGSFDSLADTVDFDPGPGVFEVTGRGEYLAKYDGSGNFLWAFSLQARFGGHRLYTVATDTSGAAYVAGTFKHRDIVDFDPGPGVFELVGDAFVAKYDTLGDFVWAFCTAGFDSLTSGIAVDDSGNIHVTGDLVEGCACPVPGPSGPTGPFLAKYAQAPLPDANQHPLAICRDVTVECDYCTNVTPGCEVAVEEIDNGSYDPDGDPITLKVEPSGPYPAGTSSVTLSVFDDGWLCDSCTATVTVENTHADTVAPEITCTSPVILLSSSSGSQFTPCYFDCFLHAEWNDCPDFLQSFFQDGEIVVTATDDCSEDVELIYEGPNDVFPVGTTVVTWTAVDEAGNTATCEQVVAVIDDVQSPPECGGLVLPGDCNSDGAIDTSDAVCLLNRLFLSNAVPLPCGDGSTSDASNIELLGWNEDLLLDISDVVGLLTWKFLGGPAHPLGAACIPVVGCPNVCELSR